MGLEARRIPLDFKHPTKQFVDDNGKERTRFIPCFSTTFCEATAEYERNRTAWMTGTHPDQKR